MRHLERGPTTTTDPGRLLGPKLIEAAEEQDHKTARRHADLLPALKGGGSLWAGEHPRPTLKGSSGWGHDVTRASTTGHSTPSRALLQKRDKKPT